MFFRETYRVFIFLLLCLEKSCRTGLFRLVFVAGSALIYRRIPSPIREDVSSPIVDNVSGSSSLRNEMPDQSRHTSSTSEEGSTHRPTPRRPSEAAREPTHSVTRPRLDAVASNEELDEITDPPREAV